MYYQINGPFYSISQEDQTVSEKDQNLSPENQQGTVYKRRKTVLQTWKPLLLGSGWETWGDTREETGKRRQSDRRNDLLNNIENRRDMQTMNEWKEREKSVEEEELVSK